MRIITAIEMAPAIRLLSPQVPLIPDFYSLTYETPLASGVISLTPFYFGRVYPIQSFLQLVRVWAS